MAPRNAIDDMLKPHFVDLGFQPRRRGWFTMPLSDGFLGVVTLSVRTRGYVNAGHVIVHVSVRSEEVERTLVELEGERYNPRNYDRRTVHTVLRALIPEVPSNIWVVDLCDSANVIPEMVEGMSDWGIPFMRSHSTLPQLSGYLESQASLWGDQIFALPVILKLLDREDEARSYLDNIDSGAPGSGWHERVHDFSIAFDEWCSN